MSEKIRKFLVFITICLVTGFVINLLIDNPYAHSAIRNFLNSQIEQHTHINFNFKDIKVRAFPPGIELYGIEVTPDNHPHAPLIRASRVKARVSIWSLVMGDPKLGLLELIDPSIVWPPPWNFPGFLKSGNQKKETASKPLIWPLPFDLPIEQIVLKDANFYFETELFKIPEIRKTFATSVVGMSGEFTYSSWQDFSLSLAIKSVNAALGGVSLLEETSISTELEMEDHLLSTKKFAVHGERIHYEGPVNANFVTRKTPQKVNVLDKINLSLAGDAKLDFALLGGFLDIPDTFGMAEGPTTLQLGIPISENESFSFHCQGKGELHDARISGFRLFNSKAEYEVDLNELKLHRVDVIVDKELVGKGKGVIKFNDQVDINFVAEPTKLHLIDLLDSVMVDFTMVDAILNSPNLQIKGTGMPLSLAAQGTVEAYQIELPETPYDHSRFPMPPACRADLRMLITDTQIDFNGTRGNCFTPENSMVGNRVSPDAISPPLASKHASSFTFGGQVIISNPGRIGLNIVTPKLDLGLAEYFATIPLSGLANVRTDIQGPLDRVKIKAQFEASSGELANAPFNKAKASVEVDGTKVHWTGGALEFTDGGHIYSPRGTMDFNREPYRLSTQIKAERITKSTVEPFMAGIGVTPSFSMEIPKFVGSLDSGLIEPLMGEGSVDFTLANAKLGDQKLFSTVSGQLEGTKAGWSTSNLIASLNSLSTKIQVNHKRMAPFLPSPHGDLRTKLGISPRDKLTIHFNTFDPKGPLPVSNAAPEIDDHLGGLPFIGDLFREIDLKGQIRGKGKFSLEGNRLQGTLDAGIKKVSLFGSGIADVSAKGFVSNGAFDLNLDQGGGALDGRLTFDIEKPGIPYEWYLNFKRFDLRALATSYVYQDPRNYIYFTGNWHLKGKFEDWWRSQGELNIQDLRGKFTQDIASQARIIQISQQSPITLLMDHKGWHFAGKDALVLDGRNALVKASLINSHPPERLGIRIESIVDLGMAKLFLPDVDSAEGKIKVVTDLMGGASDPNPVVDITDVKPGTDAIGNWQPLSLGIADIRPAFKNVHLHLNYANGKLVVDKLSADKGAGTIHATGALNLTDDAVGESRVDFVINDATIIYPVSFLKSFESQISGNVSLSGQRLPYKIAGDLNITKARSTREVDIRDEILSVFRQRRINTSLVTETPIILFDLNVTANESINIHNRNLQTVLSTNLRVRGSDVAPSVLGQVEIDKGKFIYKRDFKVTRGIVTFDDPVKPDPSLDILAVSDVEQYRVYIAITGRASDPSVEFSVDPPTRESGAPISKLEILVLLSRGKLPEESRSIGEESQSAAASEAANILLGQFEEPVEKLLDVSGQSVVRNVYLDTHPSEDGSPVPRLNLPLNLGEDTDFVLRTDKDVTELSLEYNVNENIYFSGVREVQKNKEDVQTDTQGAAGSNGDTKVNLKFRFSFD